MLVFNIDSGIMYFACDMYLGTINVSVSLRVPQTRQNKHYWKIITIPVHSMLVKSTFPLWQLQKFYNKPACLLNYSQQYFCAIFFWHLHITCSLLYKLITLKYSNCRWYSTSNIILYTYIIWRFISTCRNVCTSFDINLSYILFLFAMPILNNYNHISLKYLGIYGVYMLVSLENNTNYLLQ